LAIKSTIIIRTQSSFNYVIQEPVTILLHTGKAGEYQVIMKKIQLDLVPQPVCENQLRATRLGQYFNLDKSFTCAGGKPGKDTCTGKLFSKFENFISFERIELPTL
jgi:hypothetical protein